MNVISGVPKSGEGFIDFIGQVHKTKEQFGQDGPISVHCSAGVGRTGVFITLSIVLERMQYEGVLDVFQTVRILRSQRPAMVQTEVWNNAFIFPFEYSTIISYFLFQQFSGSISILLPGSTRIFRIVRSLRQLIRVNIQNQSFSTPFCSWIEVNRLEFTIRFNTKTNIWLRWNSEFCQL